jgi:hypothetical protein
MLKRIIACALIGVSSLAFGINEEFCRGFKEGYKIQANSNYVSVPSCPAANATPAGSTPYREGIKAGMERAKEDGYGK